MNEKISRFLDNDLSHNETLILLQESEQQPELKDKMKRYAAISYAMKTDDFLWIPTDFAMRIHREIRHAPVTKVLPPSRRPRRRYYWIALVAASTAAVAVFAGVDISWLVKQPNNPATLQIAQQTPKPTSVQITYQKAPHSSNARINDYLQEHNNSGYSNGEAFVRLANYSNQ
jgi:sigma-E factor negative regulatory protein RseA